MPPCFGNNPRFRHLLQQKQFLAAGCQAAQPTQLLAMGQGNPAAFPYHLPFLLFGIASDNNYNQEDRSNEISS